MTITAPFATTADLAARWRTLTTPEQALADILLADASNLILSECPTAATVDEGEDETVRAATLKRIVCAMVKRAMINGTDDTPRIATQQTAGPFGVRDQFANPTGDLYLMKSERRSLPCWQQVAFTVSMDTDDES